MKCQYCDGAKKVAARNARNEIARRAICPRCWGSGMESIQRHADHPDAGSRKDPGRAVKLYPHYATPQPRCALDIEHARYAVSLSHWDADPTTTYVNAR